MIGGAPFGRVGAADGAANAGFIGLMIDPLDRTVRRALLFAHDGERNRISFAFKLALAWPDASNGAAAVAGDPSAVRFGEAVFHPFEGNDGGYVGADAAGYQYLLDYRAGASSVPIYSRRDILAGAVGPADLQGRIVLIGYVSQGLQDFFFAPFTVRGREDFRTPGVVMHAAAVDQLLRHAIDGDPPIGPSGEAVEIALTLTFAIFGLLVAIVARRPWIGFALLFSVMAALLGGFHWAMGRAFWLPPAAPAAALVMTTGSCMALLFAHERRRRRRQPQNHTSSPRSATRFERRSMACWGCWSCCPTKA